MKPTVLVVDDNENDDNSCVMLDPQKMEELKLDRGDTVIVKGKRRRAFGRFRQVEIGEARRAPIRVQRQSGLLLSRGGNLPFCRYLPFGRNLAFLKGLVFGRRGTLFALLCFGLFLCGNLLVAEEAVKLAMACNAKKLALYSHDPERTDDDIDDVVNHCNVYVTVAESNLQVFASSEGQALDFS